MKLTIFIGSLSGGGAERVVCNLSNFLSERHDVTILTMADDEPAYKLEKNINRISLLRNGESDNYIIRNLKRVIRFRNYINKSDADVYLVMLPGTINMMLAHRKHINVPIIVSERCDPKTRYESSKIRKWIMRKLYPKAEGFVFQTKDAMSYYSEIIGDKGVVIPNAINEEFIRTPYRGVRKKSIISAGRFTDQKNFELLIKAFSRITKKHPDYDLIIYGDGPQKSNLKRLTKELGISEKVEFPGYVNDFGSHIIDASLFVLSSNYEGMPNSLMEAMALGLPCISTDCPVGGPGFLIDDGANGFLTPVGDVEKLAINMDELLSDKNLRDQIGESAREIADKLSFNNIYNDWESFLNEIYLNK